MQGSTLPILFPSLLLAELKACPPLRVLTPTHLFSRSLALQEQIFPRARLKSALETAARGAGVTMDWKPFWHRPQMVRNRLG